MASRRLGQLPWAIDRDVRRLDHRRRFIGDHQRIELHPFMALVLIVPGHPAHARSACRPTWATPRLRTVLPIWIQAGRITLCVSTQLQHRKIVPGWTICSALDRIGLPQCPAVSCA